MTATLQRPASESRRRERLATTPLRHIDVALVAAAASLAAIGVVMVYSATRGEGDGAPVETFYLRRQALFAGAGLVVMAVTAAIDYRRLRDFALAVYLVSVGALAAVLVVGVERKGTQAWFEIGGLQLQPSEFAKPALIIMLAAFTARFAGHLRLRHLVVSLLLSTVPMALILLQPDLGTALVFVAITTGSLLVAGARPRHIAVVTLVGLVAMVGILNSDLLAQYQRDRLETFLDPQADTQDTSFNVDQSLVTISTGGMFGLGLFQGPQTRSGAVPEQETDFIFTVVGEELGFVGACVVLGLFGLLAWRAWRTAHLAKDLFGSLLCVGVLAMFLFQLFQSVGMVTGIMPVTGIPLPFLSYGGSSTLVSFACVGLVLNVHMRRFT